MARQTKTAEQRVDERQAYALLQQAPGVTLTQCVEHYLRTIGRAGARTATVQEVVDGFLRYVSHQTKSGRRSQSTWLFYDKHLQRWAERHGSRMMADLSRQDLTSYVRGLQVSETTQHGAWRAIRAAVKWAFRQDPPMIPTDITEGVQIEEPRGKEVEFLAVAEVAAIMRGVKPEYRHALALMAFAGIRPEEITSRYKSPLQWQHIDRTARTIRIPASNAKTSRPRILEELPDNLWSWLEDGPKSGPLTEVRHWTLLRAAQVAAGYAQYDGQKLVMQRKWPNSALRHSFATYHVALHHDPGRTSLILGHEGKLALLHRNYRGLTTRDQAEQYFGIRP